jgi:hypothetical protein
MLDNSEGYEDLPILHFYLKADLHHSFWTLMKTKFFLIPPSI